jgi:hypothetical protein
MAIETIAARKDKLADENAVRKALGKLRPGATIEKITDKGKDGWVIRVKTADLPPFMKEKKDAPDSGSTDDAPSDSSDDSDSSDLDDSDDSDSNVDSDSGDKKDKGKSEEKGDVAGEIKDLIGQLQDVLKQVQDKAGEAADTVDEHKQKLDEARNALGEDGPGLDGDTPPIPSDMAGPKGKPAPPGGLGESVPSPGGMPPVAPRRPGVPSGRGMAGPRPGAPTAFSKRRTEIVSHSGFNEQGQPVTLVQAAVALESDPEFVDYQVVGMTENRDGTFSAKLRLK